MRSELVEIYSDAAKMAIMRHPGRNFPGMLIQGDTLHDLCQAAESLCAGLGKNQEVRARLDHYTAVLTQHGIAMPFHEDKKYLDCFGLRRTDKTDRLSPELPNRMDVSPQLIDIQESLGIAVTVLDCHRNAQ